MIADLLASLRLRLLAQMPVRLDSTISIGMAAYGNAATTRRALQDLRASAVGDFEVILVDDKSPDDTLEVFREFRAQHRNTRIFAFDANLEYCHSLNAFLSHARGQHLFFLSNDVFANPSYLRELLRRAAAPGCGILRGCSNFVDISSPLHNLPVHEFQTRTAYFDFAAEVAVTHCASPLVDERFLIGDAFLTERATIERIGTIDTRFIGYCGDADFGLRARLAGLRVVLVRSAFVFHQRLANILYLPKAEQEAKIAVRLGRVYDALKTFHAKYDLSIDGSVHDIPWESLARQPFDRALHYVAPGDYSRYLLPN